MGGKKLKNSSRLEYITLKLYNLFSITEELFPNAQKLARNLILKQSIRVFLIRAMFMGVFGD